MSVLNLNIVDNYWIEKILELDNTYMLHWTSYSDYPYWYVIYQDGNYLGQTQDLQILVKLQDSNFYDFKVYAMSENDAKQITSDCSFALIPEKGSRLQLQWNKISLVTNPDFYSYLIYMDSGAGFELVSEQVGIKNNKYTTNKLIDGTYYNFKIEYKDNLGNISNNNNVFSGTVESNPLPVTCTSGYPWTSGWTSGSGSGATSGTISGTAYSDFIGQTLSYNSGTRKVTITADKPSGQHPDIAFYGVYNNFNTHIGLLDHNITGSPKYIFQPSETISYTSPELHSGTWYWSVLAVDKAGFTSSGYLSQLNLDASGKVITSIPAMPYSVKTVPLASGMAYTKVDFDSTYVPNCSHVVVALNSTNYSHPYISGYPSYEYTFSGLTNGITYQVTAYSTNSGFNSNTISGNSFICDTVAPSGDSLIVLKKVS